MIFVDRKKKRETKTQRFCNFVQQTSFLQQKKNYSMMMMLVVKKST